jgi:hypothetical protein
MIVRQQIRGAEFYATLFGDFDQASLMVAVNQSVTGFDGFADCGMITPEQSRHVVD